MHFDIDPTTCANKIRNAARTGGSIKDRRQRVMKEISAVAAAIAAATAEADVDSRVRMWIVQGIGAELGDEDNFVAIMREFFALQKGFGRYIVYRAVDDLNSLV